jgi:hypothetical protein
MEHAPRILLTSVLPLGWSTHALAQSPSQVICNPKPQVTNIRSGLTVKEAQIVDRLPNKAEIRTLDRVKNPEGTHDWLKVKLKHSQSGALNTGYVYHEIVSPTCGEAASATTAQAAPFTVSPPAPPPVELIPEFERTLRGHGDAVYSAAFSPDGMRTVTASEDNTAKLWLINPASGEERIAVRDRVGRAETVYERQAEERKTAAAALECDKVKFADAERAEETQKAAAKAAADTADAAAQARAQQQPTSRFGLGQTVFVRSDLFTYGKLY